MKRNRIVIDLSQPKRSNRALATGLARIGSRREVARVLMVLAVTLGLIAAAVLVGGFFWWRSFQTSPAYSLAILTDAARREDTATADTVLDSEKVTDDFVQQVRQRTPGSSILNSLVSNHAGDGLALSPKLKQTVRDQVIREVQRLTEAAAGKPFILIALITPHFVQIEQENDTARVLVNIKDERVRLTMKTAGNRWRIVSIQDDRLAQLIADGIRRNLTTSGTQVQDEIHKQLEKLQTK